MVKKLKETETNINSPVPKTAPKLKNQTFQKQSVHNPRSPRPLLTTKTNTQAHRHDKHIVKASHFGINPRMFSRNAITVVEKLQRQGYDAYIVGGCFA